MSVKRLQNHMRTQGSMAAQSRVVTKLGLISGFQPYAVKVQFPPDTTETGWIPLGSPWVGNGWGLFCPPSIGDQVQVDFQDGSQNAPVCGLRFYDANNAPLNALSGEFWLVHAKGQFVKLTNDGMLTATDGHGAQVQMDGSGNINSKGTWNHTGNVNINGNTAHTGQVSANGHRIDDSHTHKNTQPQAGGTSGTVT